MQDNIQEIKDRIDIVELISEYIRLKKAGANFSAPCPFHKETRPSFIVSPSKQIWHCFGACDEGGDIFKFIMKIEGLEFPEALRLLAEKAGVRLKKQNPKIQSEKNQALDFNQRAAKYFQKCLEVNQKARGYLKSRGLKKKSIELFNLGYAPRNSKALRQFSSRIVFPITDSQGRAIGFTARILDDSLPKYINSPDSILYNKSRVLYGLVQAKQAIRKKDACILVEGNLDVILSHQVGVDNVIASSGSALSEEQLKIIKRLSNNLILAFDADQAGEKTTKRTIEQALAQGFDIKVLALSEKDPAELAVKGLWKKEIKQAKPVLEYFFDLALSKGKDNLENKKRIAAEVLPWIARLKNPVERGYWLEKLASELEIRVENLQLPTIEKAIEQSEERKKLFNNLEERLAALCFKYKKRHKVLKKFIKRKDELILKIELEEIGDPKKEIKELINRIEIINLREKLKDLSSRIKQGENKLIKEFDYAAQELQKRQGN